MLIRFSFKNYKSVGSEPVALEMVSSAKVRSLPDHVCSSSRGAKILRNAVIYGGNAAGKSTIVKALAFMRAAVLGGAVPQSGAGEYCKCEHGLADDETTFDIQFQVDGCVYDYGFSCILARMEVVSEWLYELGTKSKALFTRDGSESVKCPGLEEGASDEDKMRLEVYSTDFLRAMSNSTGSGLFLFTMGQGRAFAEDSPLDVFRKVRSWFGSGLEVVGATQAPVSNEYYADGKTLDQVAEVLSSFDTGIRGLRKQEVSMDDLETYVPAELLFTVRDILKANPPKNSTDRFVLTVRNNDAFLGIEREGVGEPRATILKIAHDGSLVDFDFKDESDGTRRLFDFMDIIFTKSKDKVFVIDELNRSFHPMLTQQLVKLFNRVHAKDDCQLVFTTHENDIMSYEYFRRDEIWFVERREVGTSKLFPLDVFASSGARSDARLSKRYLEGRYGGVPILSNARALAALGIEEV